MVVASLSNIKKELNTHPKEELVNLCLELAKFKKENKELLNYLLFEAGNESKYIDAIKTEVKEEFKEINKTNLYLAKKTIRRILRLVKKYIKYSGNKETEVELLIFFCQQVKNTKLKIENSKVLLNLYQRQIDNIRKAQLKLHEDLQYDYEESIAKLTL